jgi:hypothetical protein
VAGPRITVAVVGDVKGLSKALGKAEGEVGGFGKSVGKLAGVIGGAFAAREVFQFAETALAEADRLGDAQKRLELQLGDIADQLVDTADEYTKLGASTQDILELEAAFVDVGTALGVSDPLIASFADEAAATAAAVSLLGDQDAATVIDLIGKAAGGSERAMKTLGIEVTDAEVKARALADTGKRTADELTRGEIAAAAYAIILEELKPKLDAATTGSADLEQRQRELGAEWETLTGKIGAGLEGPITDLLVALIAAVDWFEALEVQMHGVQQAFKDALAPIGNVTTALADVLDLLVDVGSRGLVPNFTGGGGSGSGSGGGFGPSSSSNRPGIVVNVTPRDSADMERAVVNALRDATHRSGRTQ